MKKLCLMVFIVVSLVIMGIMYYSFDVTIENKETNYEKVVYENGNYLDSALSIDGTIDMNEQKVILMVKLSYPNTPIDMVPSLDKNSTNPADYSYKPEHRDYYRIYHTNKNNEILETLQISGYEELYVSSLAPFIEYTFSLWQFDMNKENILGVLNKNSYVKKIYVQYVTDNNYIKDAMFDGTRMAGGEQDYYFRRYTGSGITVGMLEVGVIDTTHENFEGIDVTIHDQLLLNETPTEHATMVASLIGGVKGIANEVSFLSSQIRGGLCEEIDWLIEEGADIINMSFGMGNQDGIYSSASAYIDYNARIYNKIFVVASGNTTDPDNHYVYNPGLAYNAITVGAIDTNYAWRNFSCYGSSSGPIKPNIMAKGYSIMIPNFTSDFYDGTSFSAAFVTGLSAMILERIPALINQPMKFISLMTSGATRTLTDYWYDEINNFDEKMGAGEFNYLNIIENYANAIDITTSPSTGNTIIYRQEFTLNEGDTIHAAIAWMSYAYEDDETTASRSDYDIRLMYNGYLESVGSSTFNNVEMVTFTAPYDNSDFTIMVIQYGATVITNETVSLSYNITLADE